MLGGFFAEHLHWSVIFWINVPLGFLAFAMTNSLPKKLPHHNRPHTLDVLGAVLMITATARCCWPSTGADPLSLDLPADPRALRRVAVLWAAFVLRLRSAPEPLIPLAMFANRWSATARLAACFGMGAFIGLTIYTPVYLETVKGLSASHSGLALIPLMVGTVWARPSRAARWRMSPITSGSRWAASGRDRRDLAWPAGRAGLPFVGLEILFGVISLGPRHAAARHTVCIQNAVPPHQLGTATAA